MSVTETIARDDEVLSLDDAARLLFIVWADQLEEAEAAVAYDALSLADKAEWCRRARHHHSDVKMLSTENIELRDKIAALTEEIELLRARAPRAYILSRASEWARLFREVRGYLRTCHHQHGTDFEGRQHAMNALDAALKDFDANRPASAQAPTGDAGEGQ